MSDTAVTDADAGSDADDSPALDHSAGAVVAIVAGAVLVAGARWGALELLIAVAIVQAALVGSWIVGTGLPGRIGAALLAGMAAAGADSVVSVWPHGQLGELLPVLGLMLPVAFVHQLTRGVVRNRVVESLSDIAVLIVATVSLAALIQLRHELLPERTTYVVALAIAAALVVSDFVDLVFPVLRFDAAVRRGLPAVVVGAVVAALIAQFELGGELEFTSGRAFFLGAAIGVLAALLSIGASFIQSVTSLPTSGRAVRLQPIFATLLPIALSAPVAYLLCLAIHA